MNNDILRARVSTILALVFFALTLTLGDGLYTAGTVLFTLLSAWFAASGVSQMATEKQVIAEAAV